MNFHRFTMWWGLFLISFSLGCIVLGTEHEGFHVSMIALQTALLALNVYTERNP